ncbi:iron-siderophore ABC transporter substrate-binding protein [Agrobacterium sp. MOPV5]|uniref:ABC transporter substrate-binding protein n=1 Tax=Agrobacterium leguminum TaxID=2792015 RepID=UPI0018C23966|nr:iron-siderophore ABC transporter substrate-binding protein [Agrobacterium leguminum]MBG0511111.1 iron-siderophore ABC transporter substrate-binding protein [Agrobacterium leguminum]
MIALNRRKFISALSCAACASAFRPGRLIAEMALPRVVALEWRYADHARSLGLPLVGVADLAEYLGQTSSDAQELAAIGTADMGRRQEPSLEAIIAAKPDLILGVKFRHERIQPQLSKIAQTVLYDYTRTGKENGDQLSLMIDELRLLAEKVGRRDAANNAVRGLDDFLAKGAGRLASVPDLSRQIVFAQFPSGVNNIRLFTSNSLPVRLLERLGLQNAWNGPSEGFGFTTVGPERLLALGDVTFLGVAIGADNSLTRLERNPLWQSMPFVRAGRFFGLTDVVWPFGGIPAAEAFSAKVAETLKQG